MFEFLGRLVPHGADAIVMVCQSVHHAAGLARSAAISEATRDAFEPRPLDRPK